MIYPALPPEPPPVVALPTHQEVALEPPASILLAKRPSDTPDPVQLPATPRLAQASDVPAHPKPPVIRRSDGSQVPTPNLPGSVPTGVTTSPLFYPTWAQPQSPPTPPSDAETLMAIEGEVVSVPPILPSEGTQPTSQLLPAPARSPVGQGGSAGVVVPTTTTPVVVTPIAPAAIGPTERETHSSTAPATPASDSPATIAAEPPQPPPGPAAATPPPAAVTEAAVTEAVVTEAVAPAAVPVAAPDRPLVTLPPPVSPKEPVIQKSQAGTIPIFAPPTPEQPRIPEPEPPPPALAPRPLRSPLPGQPLPQLEPPATVEIDPTAPDALAPLDADGGRTAPATLEVGTPEAAPTAESLGTPDADNTAADLLTSPADVVELTSDQQEYDEQRQIVTATGNVEFRFRQSVLTADRLQVNLSNRFVMAEGNVALRRGEQVLRGERFEYRFVQEEGSIFNANGELFLPTTGRDFAFDAPAATAVTGPQPLLSDRALATQPLRVQRGAGDFQVGVGVGRDAPDLKRQGAVRRLRFEADQVDFNAFGWQAQNVRITNDPFSPPELELRTPQATLTHISPQADELITRRPRLVFDQGFSVPLLRERTILSKEQREPGLINISYDQEERGGVYIERTFNVISRGPVRLRVTPQLLVQKAINEGPNPVDPALYGLIARLDGTLGPETSVRGLANFASLDPEDMADNLRASVRLRQEVGDHNLNLEYSYRDRLFNGSLGFQNVQSSLGVVLTSPTIPLGEDGPRFNYQVGAQVVNAKTDQPDLLDPGQGEGLVELGRYQATAGLSQRIPLWQGTPLPPTETEGLRYSPVPIVPFVRLVAGMRGILTSYTSGDFQNALTGSLGLEGQFGKFSRDFFDYTAFNVRYSQSLRDGESPFKFDRIEDRRVLALSLSQQVYGPLRFGFQTALNLEKEDRITTDYILEYSRRTYGVVLRFNPVLQIGSINLRISDFNWNGNPEPFSELDVRPVSDGVVPLAGP